MHGRRGLFVTFEGPDGSGKTTQVRLFVERLRELGYPVLHNVEPGGTRIGQQIRAILLDAANQELCARSELLLMFAARAQNVEEAILPALNGGQIVVSDRFTDSTLAYQGAARGLGEQMVRDVDRIACQGLVPDLTLCIDIDEATGLARAHRRNLVRTGLSESRIDEQSIEFHQKARAAYHALAQAEPVRFRLIDGDGDEATVATRVWDVVGPVLPKPG
jgi:dTMP kinase